MRKIRGSTGRLLAGEKRRRINAASPKPGEVVILDPGSRRVSKGVRSRNSMQVELRVETQFSADLDVRKLLDRIRINLAASYRDDLLAHQRASGQGPLPELSDKSIALEKSKGRTRSKDSFGIRSGWMAERWVLLPIRGGPFTASCTIKPNGEGGRNFMINSQLAKGVDFQSVVGPKAQIIADTIAAWLRDAVPSSGEGVGTEADARVQGGDLKELG